MPTRNNKKTLMEKLFKTQKGDDHAQKQTGTQASAKAVANPDSDTANKPAKTPDESGSSRTFRPQPAYVSPDTSGVDMTNDEVLAALEHINAGVNKLANTLAAQKAVEEAIDEELEKSVYADEFWNHLNTLTNAEVEKRKVTDEEQAKADAEAESKRQQLIGAMPWNDKANALPAMGPVMPEAVAKPKIVSDNKETPAKAGKPRKKGKLTLVRDPNFIDFKDLRAEATAAKVKEIEAQKPWYRRIGKKSA